MHWNKLKIESTSWGKLGENNLIHIPIIGAISTQVVAYWGGKIERKDYSFHNLFFNSALKLDLSLILILSFMPNPPPPFFFCYNRAVKHMTAAMVRGHCFPITTVIVSVISCL